MANKSDKQNFREAKIFSLAQVADRCIVVIEELGGPRLVPIWIGIFEGGAIAAELTGQEPPRPMTHDLIANILKEAKITMEKVLITDLRDNTYYAEIYLRANGTSTVIDSRPSDALALAVRSRCPLFVAETVFQKCPELLKPITDDEVKSFKEELKNMKPEDFFKDLKKGQRSGRQRQPHRVGRLPVSKKVNKIPGFHSNGVRDISPPPRRKLPKEDRMSLKQVKGSWMTVLLMAGLAAVSMAQDGPVAARSARPGRGGSGFVSTLERRVGLTPEQSDAVRGLMAQQRQQSLALREETDGKIRALLNPDQQKKFDAVITEQKAFRARRPQAS